MRAGRIAACAAALTLLGGLAACADPPPEVRPEAVPVVAPPVMEPEQVERVLGDLGEVLAAGDAALEAERLTPRVGGPALTSRTAQYTVASAVQDTAGITVLPTAPQVLIVPDEAAWPRTVVVVTEQPEDLQSPRLLVLRQEEPRAQYVLWGWARLLPGASMPPTADPSVGSAVLAPDAPDLLVTPGDVIAQYADVLANGDASEYAQSFEPDATREAITTTRESFRTAVENAGGSLTETYEPVDGDLFAFATADGGALVISGLHTVTQIALEDSTLTVSGSTAALLGKTEVRGSMSMTWTDVLVFDVPPAGSAEPVRVIAAEHVLTSVSGE